MFRLTHDHLDHAGPDPLGVLAGSAMVVNAAASVTIADGAIDRVAGEVIATRTPPPAWDAGTHYRATGEDALDRTIGWVVVLDALNFCFWAQGDDPDWRWRIESGGTVHDGYMALAIALRDAANAGLPVWEPNWLAAVNETVLARLFRPVPGSAPIPLLAERAANLRELGTAMQDRFPGPQPWTALVAEAKHSAPRLAQAVIEAFPSFNDAAPWSPPGGPGEVTMIPFHKRAQILASDLAATLEGFPGTSPLTERDQLTAFADYKVPQVLRHLGILRYDETLAGAIQRRELLPAGSRPEVEIRAATIWGCELLRQRLETRGACFTAADVDWLLWNAGQALPGTPEPYHRTVTIFY